MEFVVQKKPTPTRRKRSYPYVLLVPTSWDDYGYKSSFEASLHISQTAVVKLGTVKIIKSKQRGGHTKIPREPCEMLGEEYCSLGQNMNFYEQLLELGINIYGPVLTGLRDAAYDDDVRSKFEDVEGYYLSLTRFAGDVVTKARALFRDTERRSRSIDGGFEVKFETQVATDSKPLLITFDFVKQGQLPHRFNALIGYNGTGKTKLLSNLAIVASGYGYMTKEDALNKTAGRFTDPAPPFSGVIVVSYSAFDNFVIPGRTHVERDLLELQGGIFGYVYCGLREKSDESTKRREVYRLKTPQEIESEFKTALARVRRRNRMNALREILGPVMREPSFDRIGLKARDFTEDAASAADLFRGLSSGHKVVIKMLVELTSHLSDKEPMLVLIDEPETHLHPPLLAAFLRSVRACLERYDGYAIIATHSPVVLQETPGRFVKILRRAVEDSVVVGPTIETFGESIGLITQEVFNLDDGATDWHETLRALSEKHGLAEIEKMLGRPLGFAARSYVLSIRDEIGG